MVTAKKSTPVVAKAALKPAAPAKKTAAVSATVAAPRAAPKKALAKKAAPQPAVSKEQRHNYIEVAAFYVAQRRGFAPGNPLDDWATAEIEVDSLITSGHFSR